MKKRQYIRPTVKYLSTTADGELLITSINGGDTGISYGGEGGGDTGGGGAAYSNEYTFFYVWDQEAEDEEEDEDF